MSLSGFVAGADAGGEFHDTRHLWRTIDRRQRLTVYALCAWGRVRRATVNACAHSPA
jgi:hypothetical protein